MAQIHVDILREAEKRLKFGDYSRYICDNVHAHIDSRPDSKWACFAITLWIDRALDQEFDYKSWLNKHGIQMSADDMRCARLRFLEWMILNHHVFDTDFSECNRRNIDEMLLTCAGH